MKYTVYVQAVKLPKQIASLRMYVAIGIGAVIGSTLRYSISLLFGMENVSSIPWATWIVNMSGAFLLPFLLFLPFIKKRVSPILFTAFTTGLIGSYTTFSAITVELVILWQHHSLFAILYLCMTFIGGLCCSYGGYKLAKYVDRVGMEK